MTIQYASVCSGIEAATVAWEPMGWQPAWFSEIDPFASKVLAHHYPNVPNLGDMTKLSNNSIYNDTAIDLLVGGTPCQSFSIAGLRGGLDDERGNLALTYCKLLIAKRPRWFVWENVPGVFTSFTDEKERAAYNQGANAKYNPVIEETETCPSLVAKGPHALLVGTLTERGDEQANNTEERLVLAIDCRNPVLVLNDQGGDVMNVSHDVVNTLRSESHGHEPIFVATLSQTNQNGLGIYKSETANTIDTNGAAQAVITSFARRLTPLECERLQGFPDNYTKIPNAKDAPRYKAIGNSMAVPVMAWIGHRIDTMDKILKEVTV